MSPSLSYCFNSTFSRRWRGCTAGLLAGLALLTALGVGQHAEAGRESQGTSLRGTWLEQGETITGVKFDKSDPEQFSLLDIRRPYGASVEARHWSKELGWADVVVPASTLVGLHWTQKRCSIGKSCSLIGYRIVRTMQDRSLNTIVGHRDNRDIQLYSIERTTAESPTSRDWKNICREDQQGLAMGFFVPGQWITTGVHVSNGYTFACTSGVIAKCARSWGYKPWKRLPLPGSGSISLKPLHQACVRAARADYCGDGVPHTRDGTLVDLFDRYGFNTLESHTEFSAEAGFDQRGAVWVSRPRWPDIGSTNNGTVQLKTCRRHRSKKTPKRDSALVYVWSPLEPRRL